MLSSLPVLHAHWVIKFSFYNFPYIFHLLYLYILHQDSFLFINVFSKLFLSNNIPKNNCLTSEINILMLVMCTQKEL